MSQTVEERNLKVILGLTGSVASIKATEVCSKLVEIGAKNGYRVEIAVVSTNSALHFFDVGEIKKFGKVYTDKDEWSMWSKKGDPVLHIELRKWADVALIAPVDANTMAKIANGLCDNLLTCLLRAWDLKNPVVLCPAMNTFMWNHPMTGKHLQIIEEMGYTIVSPIVKTLACGDHGNGAMETPENICLFLFDFLKNKTKI